MRPPRAPGESWNLEQHAACQIPKDHPREETPGAVALHQVAGDACVRPATGPVQLSLPLGPVTLSTRLPPCSRFLSPTRTPAPFRIFGSLCI